MGTASREEWLAEGVPASDLDDLALFAPIEQWDIKWESTLSEYEKRTIPPDEQEAMKRGVFLTSVKCPKCGTNITCHLNAVTDFYHDDGEPCYDYQTDEEGLLPSPGDW